MSNNTINRRQTDRPWKHMHSRRIHVPVEPFSTLYITPYVCGGVIVKKIDNRIQFMFITFDHKSHINHIVSTKQL